MSISDVDIDAALDGDQTELKKLRHQVRLKAMDLLANREYGYQELERRLLQRDFASELVTQVLSDLVNEGLLSDERFVESFISSRKRRGKGPVRIRAELRDRGISELLISEWLDLRDPQWLQCVRDVHDKRFSGEMPKTLNERARQQRFLSYRGFTTEQIQYLFKMEVDDL